MFLLTRFFLELSLFQTTINLKLEVEKRNGHLNTSIRGKGLSDTDSSKTHPLQEQNQPFSNVIFIDKFRITEY